MLKLYTANAQGGGKNFKRKIIMPAVQTNRRTLKAVSKGNLIYGEIHSSGQPLAWPVSAIKLVAKQKTGGDKMAFAVIFEMGLNQNGSFVSNYGITDSLVYLSDDAGKLRSFGTADAAIKALVKEGLMGYANDPICTIAGEDFAAPNPYTGDPVTRAQAQYVSTHATLVKSQLAQTKAQGDLNIMNATGGYAQSVIDEKTTQMQTTQNLIDFNNEQLAVLAALITNAGGVVPTV